MFGLLASAGRALISKVLPSAINWGVNKLMTTNLGKSVLKQPLLDKAVGVINMVKNAVAQKEPQ